MSPPSVNGELNLGTRTSCRRSAEIAHRIFSYFISPKRLRHHLLTVSLRDRNEAKSYQYCWFAMSADAFKTTIDADQDGFTILNLPTHEGVQNGDEVLAGGKDEAMAGIVSAEKQPSEEQLSRRFVTWEIVEGWPQYS